MHLLDQGRLGIVILALLAMLVIVRANGDRFRFGQPEGQPVAWLTMHSTSSFYWLRIPRLHTAYNSPLGAADPTHLVIARARLLLGLEIGGMGLYVMGIF